MWSSFRAISWMLPYQLLNFGNEALVIAFARLQDDGSETVLPGIAGRLQHFVAGHFIPGIAGSFRNGCRSKSSFLRSSWNIR